MKLEWIVIFAVGILGLLFAGEFVLAIGAALVIGGIVWLVTRGGALGLALGGLIVVGAIVLLLGASLGVGIENSGSDGRIPIISDLQFFLSDGAKGGW